MSKGKQRTVCRLSSVGIDVHKLNMDDRRKLKKQILRLIVKRKQCRYHRASQISCCNSCIISSLRSSFAQNSHIMWLTILKWVLLIIAVIICIGERHWMAQELASDELSGIFFRDQFSTETHTLYMLRRQRHILNEKASRRQSMNALGRFFSGKRTISYGMIVSIGLIVIVLVIQGYSRSQRWKCKAEKDYQTKGDDKQRFNQLIQKKTIDNNLRRVGTEGKKDQRKRDFSSTEIDISTDVSNNLSDHILQANKNKPGIEIGHKMIQQRYPLDDKSNNPTHMVIPSQANQKNNDKSNYDTILAWKSEEEKKRLLLQCKEERLRGRLSEIMSDNYKQQKQKNVSSVETKDRKIVGLGITKDGTITRGEGRQMSNKSSQLSLSSTMTIPSLSDIYTDENNQNVNFLSKYYSYEKAAGIGKSCVAANTRSKTKLFAGNNFNSISNNSEASKFCSKPF